MFNFGAHGFNVKSVRPYPFSDVKEKEKKYKAHQLRTRRLCAVASASKKRVVTYDVYNFIIKCTILAYFESPRHSAADYDSSLLKELNFLSICSTFMQFSSHSKFDLVIVCVVVGLKYRTFANS